MTGARRTPRAQAYVVAMLIVPAILAGCAASIMDVTPPTLTARGTDPYYIRVNLTNNADHDLSVSSQGFRLVDADGGVYSLYREAMGTYAELGFPSFLSIGPRETARGALSFYTPDSTPPYTLKYDYAGATAEVNFIITPQEDASPPPDPPAEPEEKTPSEAISEPTDEEEPPHEAPPPQIRSAAHQNATNLTDDTWGNPVFNVAQEGSWTRGGPIYPTTRLLVTFSAQNSDTADRRVCFGHDETMECKWARNRIDERIWIDTLSPGVHWLFIGAHSVNLTVEPTPGLNDTVRFPGIGNATLVKYEREGDHIFAQVLYTPDGIADARGLSWWGSYAPDETPTGRLLNLRCGPFDSYECRTVELQISQSHAPPFTWQPGESA